MCGGERPNLFVSLEQQHQNLYSRYLHFLNVSGNGCTEEKMGIACVFKSFLYGIICLLRLIVITSCDLILESFREVLIISQRTE